MRFAHQSLQRFTGQLPHRLHRICRWPGGWVVLVIHRKPLWTQLRHLSPMDRKNQKLNHVAKAAVGGTGLSMVWAANASSITSLVVPTSRNLAGAPPGVNKFSGMGYANVRQKRLPSLGTCVSLTGAWFPDDCAPGSKIQRLRQTFYSPCHRHRQRRREKFIEPSAWPRRANQVKPCVFRASS